MIGLLFVQPWALFRTSVGAWIQSANRAKYMNLALMSPSLPVPAASSDLVLSIISLGMREKHVINMIIVRVGRSTGMKKLHQGNWSQRLQRNALDAIRTLRRIMGVTIWPVSFCWKYRNRLEKPILTACIGLRCSHEFCWICFMPYRLIIGGDNSKHKNTCKYYSPWRWMLRMEHMSKRSRAPKISRRRQT
jgi:hypothetical protein